MSRCAIVLSSNAEAEAGSRGLMCFSYLPLYTSPTVFCNCECCFAVINLFAVSVAVSFRCHLQPVNLFSIPLVFQGNMF
ncbi:hypothetical protein GDO86_003221 [Hymenochirus boettgeri]|uniref:Uncharacterized protein n=1 Tax=Hymenochirus boettgeri TaxID=247094 RepID=A0A8T2K5F8_9PIPI|nr:hypothetical protein GDO86_003221 [Hymenochirus boettgeri]